MTGFISCTRIFQMLVSLLAPFMPSSCSSTAGKRVVVLKVVCLELFACVVRNGQASKQVRN